ncbi:hypothetical protein IPN35_00050 [Candidatus Peregrinibacteria bacterium]|nr:MAG: hypothetical protein IPN35_00050 [Candidatus Peregrinibacteria bacterium]
MIHKLQILPNNKDSFQKLIKFAKIILDICKNLKTIPIVYGGLAYFYYTKDQNIPVGDLDILVPESSFQSLIKIFQEKRIKYQEIPKWKSIVCIEDNIKIDIDSIEYCLESNKKDTISVYIENQEFHILNLESLIKVYEISVSSMPETLDFKKQRELYSTKLNNLKKYSKDFYKNIT